MNFKLRIKEHRRKKGFTQEELAKKCNLTQEYVSELENNYRTNPRLQTIYIIAKALEVCPLELLECHCKYCND